GTGRGTNRSRRRRLVEGAPSTPLVTLARSPSPFRGGSGGCYLLHRQRVEDGFGLVDVTEALAMQRFEGGAHFVGVAEFNDDRRVAPRRTQPGAAFETDLPGLETLVDQVAQRCRFQSLDTRRKSLSEGLQPARLPHRLHLGA